MKLNRKILLIGLILISSVTFIACQANLFTYRGAVTKPEVRMKLWEGGPHSDSWVTDDLIVQFEYIKNQDSIKVFGDIALNHNWPVVETFLMRIHFLDADHRILGTNVLSIHGYRQPPYWMTFKRQFNLPYGTAAIGFSYDGVLRGTGDDGEWSFWLDPRRADKYGFFY